MILGRTDRAVSPVVAVILMVAVTVVLSTAVGVLVLDLGQQVGTSEEQSLGVQTTRNATHGTVTVVTGSGDSLSAVVDGETRGTLTNPAPGNTLTFRAGADESVTIVSTTGGEESVVTTSSSASGVTPPTAPTDGLIAHWKFDGDATDSIGPNDGTTYGGLTYATGKQGQAVSLDGVDDYVQTGVNATFQQDTFTVSFWMNSRAHGGNDATGDSTFLVANGDPGDGGSANWFFEYWEDSEVEWKSCDPDCIATGENISTLNEWYHVTGVYDAGTYTLYINGIKVDEGQNTVAGDAGSILIGSGQCPTGNGCEGGYFDGRIDDVRYYNRSLDGLDIARLYEATK